MKILALKQLRMAAKFVFRLVTDDLILKPNEAVCVSGNIDALGNWNFKNRLQLSPVAQNKSVGWTGTVEFPLNENEFNYRYFITSKESNNNYAIKYWETNLEPRKALKEADGSIWNRFGEYDGKKNVQRGWLITDSLIQLQFFNDFLSLCVNNVKREDAKIKVERFQKNGNCGEFRPVNEDFDVAVMNTEESKFIPVDLLKRKLGLGDNILYQTRTSMPENEFFRIIVYSANDEQILGTAFTLPNLFSESSSGVLKIPITYEKRIIGNISLRYLVVRPVESHEFNLEDSYTNYWNYQRGVLEIGHRGCGTSFSKINKPLSSFRENTIGSLQTAGNNGADFVEFDVQLSKDLVPIIFHDFYLLIAPKLKYGTGKRNLLQLPVKDLTFEEMQNLEILHVSEAINPRNFLRDDEDIFLPFPTLKMLLKTVNIHVGFNVEIKWGLASSEGVEDLPNQIDMNTYLDAILKVVFENVGVRRIVFSCFHPDVCTMLRWKQNKYPVLFLTQGKTKRYQPYWDPRTANIPEAINFALSAEILGIDVQTEEILADNSTADLCKNAGLVMFCWGDDNNDPNTIELLKNLGLNGIIYDRIDQLNPGKKNVFIREAEENVKN